MTKRLRSQPLLHTGNVTISGLAKILSKLDVDGAPGRKSLKQANYIILKKVARHFDLELENEERPFKWEVSEPQLLLQEMVHVSADLQELFAQAANAAPCTEDAPWNIIIGFDEFTTGDKKKPNNRRKTMVTSFNFMELGSTALCHESTWMTFALCRAHIIKDVIGGWPRMFRILLHMLILGDLSFSQAGCPLMLHGQVFHLYARVKIVLSDLDGLRMLYDWGGTSAHKPCIFCTNVWKRNLPLPPGEVDITCGDAAQFRPMDKDQMIGIMAIVIRANDQFDNGELNNGEFKEIVQGLGFNPNPYSLQADARLCEVLDIHSVIRTDWVHDVLAHGTFARECSLFAKSCEGIGLQFSFWRDLMKADWSFPKRRGVKQSELHNAFSPNNEETGKVIAKASEYITLYVLMRHYVERHLVHDARIRLQRESFEAACEVVELCMAAKRSSGLVFQNAVASLRGALRRHVDKFKVAYGGGKILPKHHACFHTPDQFLTDRCVVDMFVVERLNLRVKEVAEAVDDTHAWERSVSASLFTKQFNSLRDGNCHFSNGLLGKCTSPQEYPNVSLAKAVRYDSKEFHVHDIMISADVVGRVAACAFDASDLLLIVQVMEPIGPMTKSSNRYRLTRRLGVAFVADAREASAWYINAPGEYTVLF